MIERIELHKEGINNPCGWDWEHFHTYSEGREAINPVFDHIFTEKPNDGIKDEYENKLMALCHEIERLRVTVSDLSLIVGVLRGMVFSFQSELNEHQRDSLTRLDKTLSRIFYSKVTK